MIVCDAILLVLLVAVIVSSLVGCINYNWDKYYPRESLIVGACCSLVFWVPSVIVLFALRWLIHHVRFV